MHPIRVFILLFLLSAVDLGMNAQDRIKPDFGLTAGLNHTNLLLDSVTLKPLSLPYVGAFFNHYFQDNLSLHAGLQYGIRGSKYEFPIIKRKHQYFDLTIAPRYFLNEFLFVESGVKYAYLHRQQYYLLTGNTASGTDSYDTDGYQSHVGLYAGAGVQLTTALQFNLHYQILSKSAGYNNLQIGLSVSLNKLNWTVRRKKFRSLQDALANPQAVHKLILHRKKLDHLPAEIGQLTNLEELFLDGNKLTSLPPEIGALRNLKKLSVRHNKLLTLPPEIGQLENLEEIHLQYNELTSLPDEIGQLQNLRFLFIGKNYLNQVPESIGNLHKLVTLDLSNSGGLLVIPYQLGQLRNLENLIIDSTTIFEIPFMFSNPRLQIIVRD